MFPPQILAAVNKAYFWMNSIRQNRSRVLLVCLLVWACIQAGCGQSGIEPSQVKSNTAPDTTIQAYPLEVCIVSGEKLGSMGEAAVYNHAGQYVKFCCESCIDDFKNNPQQYLAKLEPGAGIETAN